jgi:hypothetical protein
MNRPVRSHQVLVQGRSIPLVAVAGQQMVAWAIIVAALFYCLAGTATVFLGWQYSPAAQWHAVNWGMAVGALLGAILGIRDASTIKRELYFRK